MTKTKLTMDGEGIIDKLKGINISGYEISLFLAAAQSKNSIPTFQRVQFSKTIQREFAAIAEDKINELLENVQGGLVELKKYDAGTKLDNHQIEFLTLSDHPEIGDQIEPLKNVQTVFTAEDEFISEIRFYVISLTKVREKPIYLLRLYSSKKELSRSKSFAAIFMEGQFNEIEEKAFLFDRYIDCMIYDDDVLVFIKDRFQKIFRYYELLESEGRETLRIIKNSIPMENFDLFENDCLNHLQKLAKLHNISKKPYLKTITMADMKRVIKKVNLKITITKRNNKELLVYDTANRWEILRLLDDDYLESIMTGVDYEVNSKRQI